MSRDAAGEPPREPGGEGAARALGLEVRDDAVALLALRPSALGIARLPPAALDALDAALREVEGLAAAGLVRALLVRAPGNGSIDRSELHALDAIGDPATGTAEAAAAQAVLRRLEQLPVPTIAWIEGPCLGAALELALACSYRVAAEPRARFGFPQIRLGLIPGLGGTVRLPRLIGLESALQLVVRGERWDAPRALRGGLVDRLFPAGETADAVAAFARERAERGRVRTGARRGMPRRLLEDTAPGRRVLFGRAARRLEREHLLGGPAARAALQAVAEGISLPLERAFTHEAELYGDLVAGAQVKALVHAALLEGSVAHPHLPAPGRVERLGVMGAGSRPMELAWRFAGAGIPVRLRDPDRGALAVAVQTLRDRLREAAGDLSASERGVEGTVGFGGFGTLDLLASADDPTSTAASALREAEEHVSDSCLLASTSPLASVEEIARGLRVPGRAVGLVLSSPGDAFPAVEVVAAAATTPEAVALACQLARRAGGTPIHVRDRPGFLVHRLLAVFLAQACRLVDEGATVGQVDAPMEGLGFAMGPLRRVDALGAQRTLHLLLALADSLGDLARPAAVLGWLAERNARFYRYRRGRVTGPNPDLRAVASAGESPSAERIRDRLLLVLVNEAARALEEGAVGSAAELDLAAIAGLGFPRRAGGLLYQADRLGIETVRGRMEQLALELGDAYRPAPLLSRLAAEGATFYGRGEAPSGQLPGQVIR